MQDVQALIKTNQENRFLGAIRRDIEHGHRVDLEVMKCPFRIIDVVRDRCVDGCRPVEGIFTTSGLNHNEARSATKNVMMSYAAIGLSDKVRDGGLVVRSVAGKFRDEIGKHMPKELNQYIIKVDQIIAKMEKSNVGLEPYINTVGDMGANIFRLAAPSNSTFDKKFVEEAGSTSTRLMVMSDMANDLQKDTKSGKYNPLKNTETSSKFDDLYGNVKNGLKNLMKKTKIESVFNQGRNICSDKSGDFGTGCAIGIACYAIVAPIACWFGLHALCDSVYHSPPWPDPMPCNSGNVGVVLFLSECCIPVAICGGMRGGGGRMGGEGPNN